jgi:ribosomal protein L11 methyltransferase
MSNIYIGYHFKVEPEVGSEILIAELGETVESFTETETGVSAFVQKELWDGTILENIRILKSAEFKIEYTYEEIDPINWKNGKEF